MIDFKKIEFDIFKYRHKGDINGSVVCMNKLYQD